MHKTILLLLILAFALPSFSQNVGIGTINPLAKLHIKGVADTTQLQIDANSVQSISHPLIKLRTSSGAELLRIHSDNPANVFVGQFAGRQNNSTANGGNNNTFIGGGSGYSNGFGSENTATGANALHSNISGGNNAGFGFNALYSNVSGFENSGFGSNALYNNTNGNYNTAAGSLSLYGNTTGKSNAAVGYYSLYSNTSGNNNTATGYYALNKNSTGINNTAIGTIAMYYNSTGGYNTATGMEALLNNTTGIQNTANGFEALYYNETGTQNTAVGYFALSNSITSWYNTAIGSRAGSGGFELGWNNTMIGANTRATSAGIFNSVALGQAAVTTASNQVRIGNSSTTSIGGYTGWTNISDGRVKKNISENVPGLAFINKLKPVTYNLDLNAADEIMQLSETSDKTDMPVAAIALETAARKEKEQVVYSGFIAQDVEKAAKELGYNFSGVDPAKNDKDLYGLRYAEFVVPIVKAVQELSKENDGLLKRIEKLESLILQKNNLYEKDIPSIF